MIFTWKGGVMTVAAGIEVAVAVLSEFVMVTAKQQQQQQQQQQQTMSIVLCPVLRDFTSGIHFYCPPS